MDSDKSAILKCSLCKQYFNLKNREPIIMMCCQETACRECAVTLMIKSENKEVVIKGQFDCSFCHSDHCQEEGFEAPVKLRPNKHIKK